MLNADSFILYMLIFIISILFVKRYQYKRYNTKLGELLTIMGIMLPIIIVQGIRYDVGTDYISYYNICEMIGNGNTFVKEVYLNEPIFLVENILLYKIFHSPIAIFVFHAILMNILFSCFKTV